MAEELGYALAPSPLAAHWAAKLLHPELEGRGTVAMWDGEDGATQIAVPNADVCRRQDRGAERDVADTLVVTAEGGRTSRSGRDATIEPARALDATRPLFTVRFDGAPARS